MSSYGDITVKPEIALLEDVLKEIESGRLRVPRFQRAFIWTHQQMVQLFDSIERGYPVGSLLLWETSSEFDSLETIAGIRLPKPPGGQVSYVIDGHQRLSTLYGCLMRRPPVPPAVDESAWRWNVYRVLGRSEDQRFRHAKRENLVLPNFLPMRSVLRTIDFLAYARTLAERDDATALIDEAERVAQQFKAYRIAVVRLVGGTLSDAVEVFARLNSSGAPMTPTQMVSALTYHEGDESLADGISALQNDVGDIGFGRIETETLFQSMLAVAGEVDIRGSRWDVLAGKVRDRSGTHLKNTELALHRAIAFLREVPRVPLARLIPYSIQLILLTSFFHEQPEPTTEQVKTLERWFWLTSWSGAFAGTNTTEVRKALAEMRGFAHGEQPLNLDGMTPNPFPDRFDFRSARVRAYVIWELQHLPRRPRSPADPHPIDAVTLLATDDVNAYRHVITRGKGDYRSSAANRLVFPTAPGTSVYKALLALAAMPDGGDVFAQHAIPPAAVEHLRQGRDEEFVRTREEHLAALEQVFMDKQGASRPDRSIGPADIDTG